MVSNWYKQFMAEAGVDVGSRKVEKRPPGPAMDLKNMRITAFARSACIVCIVEWSAASTLTISPSTSPSKASSAAWSALTAGAREADVRPNWIEKGFTIPKPEAIQPSLEGAAAIQWCLKSTNCRECPYL